MIKDCTSGSEYDQIRAELKTYVAIIAARCDATPASPTLDELMDTFRSIRFKVQYAEKMARSWKKGKVE